MPDTFKTGEMHCSVGGGGTRRIMDHRSLHTLYNSLYLLFCVEVWRFSHKCPNQNPNIVMNRQPLTDKGTIPQQYLTVAIRQLKLLPDTIGNRKKFIMEKQQNYPFGPDNPRRPYFYLLSKLPKPLDTWTIPFEVAPGRLMVSDCNRCHMSHFTKHWLRSTCAPCYS